MSFGFYKDVIGNLHEMRLDQKLVDKCADRFAKEAGLLGVWMFGSAVSGSLRKGSDVDFALYYEQDRPADLIAHGTLVADLEAILERRVDVGVLSTRNLVYAHQATQRGVLIQSSNPQMALAFSGLVLTLYLEFKDARREIEEAYCVR